MAAFLRAVLVNSSRYPILPGPLSVFKEGDFVVKSNISNLVTPNDFFSIYLGADEGIKVLYAYDIKPLKDTGVFQKTSSVELMSITTVNNNTNKDIVILMFEQLPKSSTSDIKVTLVEPPDLKQVESYATADLDAKVMLNPSNNVRWRIPLTKGAQHEFKFLAMLEYPSESDIIASDKEKMSSVLSTSSGISWPSFSWGGSAGIASVSNNPLYSGSSSSGVNPFTL